MTWQEDRLARKRGSYKFDKRQRELAKQKKKKEKLERRQNKQEEPEPVPGEAPPLQPTED